MQPDADEFVQTDPESKLERAFIAEYLERNGSSLAALHDLPAAEAAALMKGASIYASAKLSEVEARAHYIHDIHDVSKRSQ
jgi:ribosomal 30S subunit maturation factor RimM